MTIQPGCLVHDRQPVESALREMLRFAHDQGWEYEDMDEQVVNGTAVADGLVKEEDELQYLSEASDDAEEWLNDHVADDRYRFGWEDGEFFYMPVEWWPL